MKTHRAYRRDDRSRPGRPRLGFDRLEVRLALSAATGSLAPADATLGQPSRLSVVSVDTATGQAADTFAVTFDRPVLNRTASDDFVLDAVSADGSETPVSSSGLSLQESIDDTTHTIDTVTTGTPLGPGRYRLYLAADAGIAGADGSTVGGAVDRLIDDFTVASQGPDFGDATDLGSPVSTIASATGSLDLANDPAAEDLYRVELPQGHFWRLGVELDAARFGSPLLAALTLYDAQGHPIPSVIADRPDFPNDPSTFVGLNPGVYYIGVAAASDSGASSGSFRLQAVADPADTPTALESWALDYADPTEDIPTGLTLQFAGPMDEAAMQGDAADLIRVVDASGRSWTADVVGYDESESAVTFVFDQQLPAGRYTVELGGQGGLVDLVGKAPIAPGLPIGTLATFTVSAATPRTGTNDYGPIFPGEARAGLAATLKLGPGQETTNRFVITTAGYYDLETTFTGAVPTLKAEVGGKGVILFAGREGVPQPHGVFLEPGTITLSVQGGPAGSTIHWAFLLANGQSDSLLDNGAGQSSALSLRLVAPTPLGLQASPSGDAGGGGVQTPAATSATASNNGPAPGGLYVPANAGLVGHPSSLDGALGAVGPVAPGGSTALSSTAAGLPQGLAIGFGESLRSQRGLHSGAIEEFINRPEPVPTELTATEVRAADALPPLPDAEAETPAAGVVVQSPGLVERASALIAGLLPGGPRVVEQIGPNALDDAALAELGRDPLRDGDGAAAVETADLTNSLGVGVIAVAAAHYHKRLGRWLGRFKTQIDARRQAGLPSGPRRPTA